MASIYPGDDFSEEELAKAKQRLAEFEAQKMGVERMARLRHANPRHPLLLGMGFTMFSGAVMLVLAVALAVAPLASDDLARTFASVPAINVIPVALVGLAICSGLLWIVMYGLALAQGANSPLLPRDLKELNRLRSDVQRLQVAKDVQRRLTNTPAPARTRRY